MVDEKRDGLIQNLQFSPNNQHLVTTTESGALELWDMAGNLIDTFIGHHEPINQIRFSPDGQYLVSSSDDGTARLWHMQPETFRHVHKPNDLAVVGINFANPKGYMVTESNLSLHLWDFMGHQITELPGDDAGVALAKVSADGQIAATLAYDGKSALWKLNADTPQSLVLKLLNNIIDLDLSASGDYLVVHLETDVTQLWSVEETQVQPVFERLGIAIALSAEGQTIANLTVDGAIEILDPQGNLKNSFSHPDTVDPNTIWDIYVSPDGKFVATWTEEREIYLWDSGGLATATIQLPSSVTSDRIQEIAISPDGQWLAAGTKTGAYLISITDQKTAHLPHSDEVIDLQFSPDSQHLTTLSADADGTARVWRVETSQSLLGRSCQWITPYLKNLSNQELTDELEQLDLCRNITSM